MDNIKLRALSMVAHRVPAVMFSSVGEDDRHRRWIWKGVDMQIQAQFLEAFMCRLLFP